MIPEGSTFSDSGPWSRDPPPETRVSAGPSEKNAGKCQTCLTSISLSSDNTAALSFLAATAFSRASSTTNLDKKYKNIKTFYFRVSSKQCNGKILSTLAWRPAVQLLYYFETTKRSLVSQHRRRRSLNHHGQHFYLSTTRF